MEEKRLLSAEELEKAYRQDCAYHRPERGLVVAGLLCLVVLALLGLVVMAL